MEQVVLEIFSVFKVYFVISLLSPLREDYVF